MRPPSTALFAAAVTLSALAARAQIPTGPVTFELRSVVPAGALTAPVQFKPIPDTTGRTLIVDQAGKLRVLQNGVLLPTPMLDLAPLMVSVNPGYDERGLLGVAIDPAFATSGRIFVRYSRPRAPQAGDPCNAPPFGCHTEVLAEYVVSPPTANVVAGGAASGVVLFTVDKPQFNHNSGGIAFGPDGKLFMAMGDGGGANDGLSDMPPSHGPTGNGQNLATSMGKVLRFDVSTPGVAVPAAGNPFLGNTAVYQPIYAYGFRNPYDFSFDDFGPGHTNALILADVGQDAFEEVDIVTSGGNYGWAVREGLHCFDAFATTTPPATCPGAGMIDPVLEYPHSFGPGQNVGLAALGGYVYRGAAFPGLTGLYLFGDFSTSFGAPDGHLFYADMSAGPATPGPLLRPRLGATNRALGKFVKGMGRDAAGEVYVLVSGALGPSGTTGDILKIVPCPSDYNASAQVELLDIFGFLTGWFGNDPRADFDRLNGVDLTDIFGFLTAWFGGC